MFLEAKKAMGGGSGVVLQGTLPPMASQGQDGEIYLEYFGSDPSGIPDTATPLLSITTDGSQWIQTGYAVTRDDVVFEIDVNVNTLNSGNTGLISRSNASLWIITHISGSPNLTAAWGGVDIRSNQYDITGRRVHIRFSKGRVYVTEPGGTVICDWSYNSGSTYSNTQLTLFGYAPNDSLIKATFYGMKIYEGDTLVRNYRPVLDENNVPCLYDTVTHAYFYNSGSGTFSYTAPTGEIVASYLKVNNAWQNLIGSSIYDVG